ncbi:MAG: BrnA antitoxin family protein [Chloroflexia bacterium]|jgi:uncharacterized protein (DUF4415 family)|nr:BrnA antitoxin family protein [Chloroflexia bacterium]
MSAGHTSQEIERLIAEDNSRLAQMSDEDIDYSDIPRTTEWTGAVRGKLYQPPEGQVMLPIDHDVLAWFRATDADYLTAINTALREYMERHRGPS